MGCFPARDKKYLDVKNSADFIGTASEYGVLLISIEIDDRSSSFQWSKEKKEWFEKRRQMILNFMGVSAVKVLPTNSRSHLFDFRLPFSKDGFKAFQKPFSLEFDYNNFYSGFVGVVQTSKILQAYLSPMKEETKISFLNKEEIPINIHYAFIGTNLLSDLKQFSLDGIDLETQKNSLLSAIEFTKNSGSPVLNQEHGEARESFWGGNTQEMLIRGFLKNQYEKFQFQLADAIDYYSNQNEENEKNVAFPPNFEDLFQFEGALISEFIITNLVKKYSFKRNKLIFGSVPFFKKVVQMWIDNNNNNNCQDYYFQNPKDSQETFQKILQSGNWFYDIVVKRVFEEKDARSIEVIAFFMKNFPETRDYLLSIEKKINFDALEGMQVGYYLKNYLYTPDFHFIKMKMMNFYGHVAGNGTPISNVFKESQRFSSNKGEQSNITVIGQEEEGRHFVVTHIYLKGCRQTYSGAIYTAVYFLPSEIPSEESIKKFHGLTKERFDNGDYPQDDVLKPVAFLDVKGKECQYDEVRLNQPLLGRYFVCIFLKARPDDEKMDIGNTGCFGFLGDQPQNFDGLRLNGGGKRVFKPEDGKDGFYWIS